MNLDHVITDDEVRADIDKIQKVRPPEHAHLLHTRRARPDLATVIQNRHVEADGCM